MRSLCLAHGGDVSQPSGGTDRITALAGGLAERGFDVSLVVPEPDGSVPESLSGVSLRAVGVSRFGVSNALTRAEKVASEAKRIADERNALLQLEHSTLAGVGTFRGCRDYVLDMHDIAYPRYDHVETIAAPALKRIVRWLERRGLDRADHVIVVSEYMENKLATEWGLPADSITVVPNGYFPERVEPYRGTDTHQGRVVFLGTLHPKVDVEALSRISQLDEVTDLVVIGDGANRERVEQLAAERENVRTTGRLPDEEAFPYVASARVVVNPQDSSELQRSSSPVKLFYYAAFGRPMVVTRGPSIVDELVGNDAGLAAESRDEFVDQVERVMTDNLLAQTLSESALQLSEGFKWSRRIKTVDLVLRNVSDRGMSS